MPVADPPQRFRWLVAACAAATVILTWRLWQLRDSPPMLPLLSLPRFDLALPLVGAIAVSLRWPLAGALLYAHVLTYGILIDQTRIQPQMISFGWLLLGSSTNATARLTARVALISMWGWAGLNKLASYDFLTQTGPSLLAGIWPAAPQIIDSAAGYATGGVEVALALLLLVPRTRVLGAVIALCWHAFIPVVLSRAPDPNIAVWPWNAALAASGFALFVPWKRSLAEDFSVAPVFARALIVILLVLPAGFHVGVVDAYVAHDLYTSNTPLTSADDETRAMLRVPLPPEQRLIEQRFQLTCREGDTLLVLDRRWWFRMRGTAGRRLECRPRLE